MAKPTVLLIGNFGYENTKFEEFVTRISNKDCGFQWYPDCPDLKDPRFNKMVLILCTKSIFEKSAKELRKFARSKKRNVYVLEDLKSFSDIKFPKFKKRRST